MLHDRGHRAGGADFDPNGITQGPVCQLGDFGRQGGGKEKGLPVFGNLGNDSTHRRQESDIEHAVHLIQNEDLDVIKADSSLLHVILQTARRGDKDIDALFEHRSLGSVADPAKDATDAEIGKAGKVAEGRLDLHREFPGRLQNEAAATPARVELLENGQGESGCLSGAGLGRGNEVAPFEGRWNRAELDRSGIRVTHGLNALQKWLGNPKRGKWHKRASWGRACRVSMRGIFSASSCRTC